MRPTAGHLDQPAQTLKIPPNPALRRAPNPWGRWGYLVCLCPSTCQLGKSFVTWRDTESPPKSSVVNLRTRDTHIPVLGYKKHLGLSPGQGENAPNNQAWPSIIFMAGRGRCRPSRTGGSGDGLEQESGPAPARSPQRCQLTAQDGKLMVILTPSVLEQ